jgi:transposase InsO family protein
VYIDIFGPFWVSRYNTLQILPGKKGEPAPQEEMKYILIVEDDWSRFIDLIPIPSKDAGTVASRLLDEFVTRELPGELYSDQGKELCNKVFTELSNLGKYHHDFSKAYNPQDNQVERFHRILGIMLTINLDRDDVNWVSKLAAIKLAYNYKVHRSIGVTPALAFLGHEVKLPINLQENYSSIFTKMYANQDSVNRTKARL